MRYRAVFNWVSNVISELLWFMITSLSDWFKVLAPFFQPIRRETKTNHGLRVHNFPRFVSATCTYFEFWLVYWIAFLICQSNYFGFGFTTLDWNSLYTFEISQFLFQENITVAQRASNNSLNNRNTTRSLLRIFNENHFVLCSKGSRQIVGWQ